MIVTPGNSREVLVDCLSAFTPTPQAAASATIQSMEKAGFGLIHVGECAEIIKGLLTIAKIGQPPDIHAIDPRVIKAKAFVQILED